MKDQAIGWLLAQLNEEKRVAQAAWRGDGWRVQAEHQVWTGKSAPGHTPIPIADAWDPGTAAHIARHDPASVLRRVEADRLILDGYQMAVGAARQGLVDKGAVVILEPVIRYIASVYADRPGFPEELRIIQEDDVTP